MWCRIMQTLKKNNKIMMSYKTIVYRSILFKGCPSIKYGKLCEKSCPEKCYGPCDLETGCCISGCSNGWIGEKCVEGIEYQIYYFLYQLMQSFDKLRTRIQKMLRLTEVSQCHKKGDNLYKFVDRRTMLL